MAESSPNRSEGDEVAAPESRAPDSGLGFLGRWLLLSLIVFMLLILLQVELVDRNRPPAPGAEPSPPSAEPAVMQDAEIAASESSNPEPSDSQPFDSEAAYSEPSAPEPTEDEAATPPAEAESTGGGTYGSREEFFAQQKQLGYEFLGRFGDEWPATIVEEQTALNEIMFKLFNGQKHIYPGYDGYRLKVVRLQTELGTEAVVVLRSIEKE